MVKGYSDTQYKILLALARYQYLTLDHFKQLGIAGNVDAFRRRLNELVKCKRPFVAALSFADNPHHGRKPYIYYLTKSGVRVLEEMEDTPPVIRRPTASHEWARDYPHRVAMITALINAENAAPALFRIRDLYYEKNRNIIRTTIAWKDKEDKRKTITPDAVFSIGKQLYIMELTNKAKWQDDRKKLMAYKHPKAVAAFCKKYSYNGVPRVLFVYKHSNTMNLFLKWGANDKDMSGSAKGLALVKSLENTRNGQFYNEWRVVGHDQDTYTIPL